MSTAQVYEATNYGNLATSQTPTKSPTEGMLDDYGYVSGQLAGKPTPLRSPAQVMRIWVAPREDTNGDLVMPGYVFTEIEPRRWVMGAPDVRKRPHLRPLKTRKQP